MFERTTHESELRTRVNQRLDSGRQRLLDLETNASQSAERVAAALDTYIRENPWTSVAIGASLGLILGAFVVSFVSGSSDD
jgi:ElaB/YqjD/DUF883 family membrane-anchored ribosome-binding protein